MTLAQRWQEIRTGFHPTFWVANTLELFERLAYYGSKSVLTVFLANKVGLNEEAGFLAGLFNAVLYSLPIVAGVFVDKYGFKRTLMACFAIFCLGYFLIGLAGMEYGQVLSDAIGKKNYVIIVLMLTAIGGSLIKPCVVGTVAKTSKPQSQALGFSIYYTLVNLGGAIGPMIAYFVRTDLGIEFVPPRPSSAHATDSASPPTSPTSSARSAPHSIWTAPPSTKSSASSSSPNSLVLN